MATKTHSTAVVLIPPEEVWEPIQQIRRQHDKQVQRWMPHVTLLYPFRPREEFDAVGAALAEACRAVEPFEVELAELRWFPQGRDSFTLWLAPKPAQKLAELEDALWRVVPDCDDVRRFVKGFTPHLSVGQVLSRRALNALVASLQADWQPLRFVARQAAMIWRNEPPDDVFRVGRTLPLGRS